jgi:hypothetical protein
LTFVVVYEIAQPGLAPLMRDRPSIADELALTLSRRGDAERQLFGQDEEIAAETLPGLVARIRHLFEVPLKL